MTQEEVRFRDPSGAGAVYIDPGEYTATLIDLRQSMSDRSFDGRPPQMRVCWVFRLTNVQGEVMEDDHGLPLEWHVWTSQALGAKARARPIAQALLARKIDDMKGEEVARAVKGHSCKVLIADQYLEDGESVRSIPVSWSPLRARPPEAA